MENKQEIINEYLLGQVAYRILSKKYAVSRLAVNHWAMDFQGRERSASRKPQPAHQKQYYNYILSLKPKHIIFNPGTANEELEKLATENNIQPVEACTLVLLSTGQY